MPRKKAQPIPKEPEPKPMIRTNTRKFDYHITVDINGKTQASFVAHTDSLVNALKSAYGQACGWTFTPVETLSEKGNCG